MSLCYVPFAMDWSSLTAIVQHARFESKIGEERLIIRLRMRPISRTKPMRHSLPRLTCGNSPNRADISVIARNAESPAKRKCNDGPRTLGHSDMHEEQFDHYAVMR